MYSAIRENEIALVRFFLKRGDNMNQINSVGNTPLHQAVLFGRIEIVKMLVEVGALLSVRNAEGKTAFEMANEEGMEDIAQLLADGLRDEGQ